MRNMRPYVVALVVWAAIILVDFLVHSERVIPPAGIEDAGSPSDGHLAGQPSTLKHAEGGETEEEHRVSELESQYGIHLRTFKWDPKECNLVTSIRKAAGLCNVKRRDSGAFEQEIIIQRGNAEPLIAIGHERSSFVVDNAIVYFAEYWRLHTGCRVIAYDLNRGKTVWRKELRALIFVIHSCYSNHAMIEQAGENVLVWGNEAGGKYVECLSKSDGSTQFHIIYEHYAPLQLSENVAAGWRQEGVASILLLRGK